MWRPKGRHINKRGGGGPLLLIPILLGLLLMLVLKRLLLGLLLGLRLGLLLGLLGVGLNGWVGGITLIIFAQIWAHFGIILA